MTNSHPQRETDADAAADALHAALGRAGIVLPSLTADTASPDLGLVQLGRVRADVALRLAEVIEWGAGRARG
ncbi:hypothetical protein [Streptomyces sp. NPDC003077]|uniref:hypothetical protein n=1 Tax=Streptomyces sp. NPDC003077 TaxID=3154443 RepID=UPI0033A741C0